MFKFDVKIDLQDAAMSTLDRLLNPPMRHIHQRLAKEAEKMMQESYHSRFRKVKESTFGGTFDTEPHKVYQAIKKMLGLEGNVPGVFSGATLNSIRGRARGGDINAEERADLSAALAGDLDEDFLAGVDDFDTASSPKRESVKTQVAEVSLNGTWPRPVKSVDRMVSIAELEDIEFGGDEDSKGDRRGCARVVFNGSGLKILWDDYASEHMGLQDWVIPKQPLASKRYFEGPGVIKGFTIKGKETGGSSKEYWIQNEFLYLNATQCDTLYKLVDALYDHILGSDSKGATGVVGYKDGKMYGPRTGGTTGLFDGPGGQTSFLGDMDYTWREEQAFAETERKILEGSVNEYNKRSNELVRTQKTIQEAGAIQPIANSAGQISYPKVGLYNKQEAFEGGLLKNIANSYKLLEYKLVFERGLFKTKAEWTMDEVARMVTEGAEKRMRKFIHKVYTQGIVTKHGGAYWKSK